jgi:peptidoglycan/LPS O-acetylase OafA/YrhL
MIWVDRFKGLALIWVFWSHAAEKIWGGLSMGNPHESWPSFSDRLRELQPLEGHGGWDLPLNVFRTVGLLGDQAIPLFLIASGFALTASLFKHRDSGTIQWGQFYSRRLWRIYPLWWAVHIPHLLFKWASGPLPPGHSLHLLLSLAGLRVDGGTFYFYSTSWWFIGLLLQLYIFFPLAWILMKKLGPIRFLAGVLVVSAAARGAGMAFFGSYMDPFLRGSVFITRLPEFALGMVLAQLMQDAPNLWDARLRSRASTLIAAGLYLVGTAISLTWVGMTVAPFVIGLGSFAVLYPLLNPKSQGNRIGILGWVGVHSYGIYLVHESTIHRLMPPSVLNSRVILLIFVCAGLSVLIGAGLEWAFGRATDVLASRGATSRAPSGEAITS